MGSPGRSQKMNGGRGGVGGRCKEIRMQLYELNEKRMRLFARYEKGELSKKEYLRLVRPLDEAVDRLEMACLTDRPASEKGPSGPSGRS